MAGQEDNLSGTAGADLSLPDQGRAVLRLSGTWSLQQDLPDPGAVGVSLYEMPDAKSLGFQTDAVVDWDSALVSYLMEVINVCRARGLEVDDSGLPEGVQGLLKLAYAVPERKGARRKADRDSFLERLGNDAVDLVRSSGEIIEFFGNAAIAFRQMLRGKARFRTADLWLSIQEAGADALPIISLVSTLVGLILGYIGIQQLEQFGAKIFVADLVGLATVIQMGALITAIVLAGRTGAAFAAQLGTMQVNEEIDALRTLGVSPMEFLVLPRLIALILMTPLLALYANAMGIFGGALVAAIDGDLTMTGYFVQTQQAIGLNHVAQGLISAAVYGAIVAVSGCLRGMQCGRSASSVGLATTSAVVTSIVFIVIAAAVLTIIFQAVGL
ncbi:MAG: ABC transporter permease [Chromatiaceae bacterium]